MERETFEAKDVLRSLGDTKVKEKGTFVQKAGVQLAVFVGALITIVTLTVLIFFCKTYPAALAPTDLAHSNDPKNLLDQYKELTNISISSAQSIFQTIISQALLPVFTAILGYIFARGSKEDS